MSSALDILERKRTEIEALCIKYGVTRLRVFGSVLRANWDVEHSDFDFLAEFGPPPTGINLFKQLFGFSVSLEHLMGRPVDVVDWKAVQNPIFRQEADSTAKEWYAA